MNILLSCIGKRGYLARYFREALGPEGCIVGTSNTKWTPGFAECDNAFIVPDIASEQYPRAVLDLCKTQQISAVFSFYDPDVHRLSRYRDSFLANGIVPFFPDEPVSTICFDKFQTHHFLSSRGYRTPKTYDSHQSVRLALESGAIRYPLIVKPRCGFGSLHTHLAQNDLELQVFCNINSDMLVQPFVTGESYCFDICNDLSGRPVSVVLWRRLRSSMGETEHVITVKDDALLELGAALAKDVATVGPMDVDLFVDDDGEATIIELNPRFGGGYPASHLAGADFPGLLIRMLRGETVASRIGDYASGIVMLKSLGIIGGEEAQIWQETLHLTPDSVGER